MGELKLPQIKWPEERLYYKYEGEAKLAEVADDILKIKGLMSDLKLMQNDLTYLLMQEAIEQKRFDLFTLNWRRVQKLIMQNL